VKQAEPTVAWAGQPLAYTILVTNTGNLTLHAVVTDTPPPSLSLPAVLTWTPTILPDETWRQTVAGDVAPGYGGLLTNVVRVAAEEGVSAVYTITTFSRYPALTVTKQVTPPVISPGEAVTYTLRVTNTGNISLTTFITDYLPAGVVPISGSRVLTWQVVLTAPQGTWTHRFVATSTQSYSGTLTNQVAVAAAEGASSSAAASSVVLFAPGLAAAKEVEPAVAPPGGLVTYTIRVTNTGNVVLHVTVSDTLPAGVGGGVLTWTPTIARGATWTQVVTATVNQAYSGTLTNQVQAVAIEGPSGSATAVSEARYAPGLQVGKTAAPLRLAPGDIVTYTLRVTNTGNISLTTAITDDLPSGVTATVALAWQTVIPVGRTWEEVFTATVQAEGHLENRVEAVAAEGVSGSDGVTIISLQACRNHPTAVTISKPNVDEFVTNTAYVFVATVTPSTATLPFTYTWQATDQGTVVHNRQGIVDTAPLIWLTPGEKWITVTVVNRCGIVVQDAVTIAIAGPQPPPPVPLGVEIHEPSVSGYFTGTAYTFTAWVTPITATLPLSYTWQATGQTTVVHVTAAISDAVAFTWPLTGSKRITVSVANGEASPASDSITITVQPITAPPPSWEVYLPLVLRNR
ncbi:MAG TPA: DUF11 domain-containing protein, partial [Anaerolineae bacterium]|nr:DUF11 domain-containing protein [Anaerolineae bacterium]